MGKHATYRKRGGVQPTPPALPAPPQPLFLDEDGDANQYATGGDDTGGTLELWRSSDGNAPWDQQDQVPWAAFKFWGSTGDLGVGHYRTTETGNGIAYAGTSPPSDIIVVS